MSWIPGTIKRAISNTPDKWRIGFDGDLKALPGIYAPPEPVEDARERLKSTRKAMRPLQRALRASARYGVLAVFQALDAAGKDGAIRQVFRGLDPAGVDVTGFKQPSREELAHDFLWRTSKALPARGQISIFNRSYYEELLIVRVHPALLDRQYGGTSPNPKNLWPARYQAIREHELHLARSNVLVLKFWLDVSPGVQAQRFLERLETPSKRWKFSSRDVEESGHRKQYDDALLHIFDETSRPWAPWFCIPADDRWFARWQISEILFAALSALPLDHPEGEKLSRAEIAEFRQLLEETSSREP